MKKLLLLLSLVLPLVLGATNVDSLKAVLDSIPEDFSKVDILIGLGSHEKTKPENDLEYIEWAILIAQKHNYLNGEGEAFFAKAEVYISKLQEVELAIDYYEKSAEVFFSAKEMERASDALNEAGGWCQDIFDYEKSHRLLKRAKVIRDSLMLNAKLAQTLQNIANTYMMQGKINEMESPLMQAFEIRLAEGDEEALTSTYTGLFNFYDIKKEYDTALIYGNKSLELNKEFNQHIEFAKMSFNMGSLYNRKGDLEKAMEYYTSAIKIFEEKNFLRGVSACALGMSLIKEKQLLFDEASEYLDEALKVNIQLNDKKSIAHCYNNQAKLISKKDSSQIDTCIILYNNALDIYNEIKDLAGVARASSNIGTLLWKKGDYEKAIPFLKRTIRINEENGRERESDHAYISLGKCYIKNKDPHLAKIYLTKALIIGEETNDFYLLEGANESLGKVHSMLGDFKIAYSLQRTASEFRDSIYNKKKVEAVNEIEAKYKVEKEKQERVIAQQSLDVQKAINNRQWTLVIASVIGLLLSVLIAVLFARQNSLRKKANQALAEKNKLQIKNNRVLEETNHLVAEANEKLELKNTEIKHRTGNSFTTIISLLRLQKRSLENEDMKQLAAEMENRVQAVTILSKLLDSNATNNVNILNYLSEVCDNLEQTNPNYYQNLKVSLDIDDIEIDGQYASDIGLITNELMTNSFKHAFAGVASPAINITFQKSTPNTITMLYQDNGKGIPVELNVNDKKSMGLKLINRLAKGLDGTVEIKNEKGLTMTFKFPEQKLIA